MLDTERQYFQDHQEELLKAHPGRFVIIREQRVIGAFDTLEDALSVGAREFGLSPFLVRRTDERPSEVCIPALALGILRAPSDVSTQRSGANS
ncbi:MAG: hypothetical protein ABSH00_18035 [Bryobacteraceae bacterium]|jgi:hypothetical protein